MGSRAWAKPIVALLIAASMSSGATGTQIRVESIIGHGAVRLADGAWLIRLADGSTLQTHGPDPVPNHGGTFNVGDPERPPACATDYYQHVLYGYHSGSTNRYASVKAQIQASIRRINAALDEEALESGNRDADYKVRCDENGAIQVDQFSASASDFASVVNGAKAAGFNLSTVKYTIFYDEQPQGVCGIGSLRADESLSVDNANNTGGSYAIAYNQCWDNETPMHENGHNMGAVQYNAPYSTGNGYHCYDENDVMCYSPDGGDKNQSGTISRCTDRIHFDCGNDTYFDAKPEDGEYLASHWNIGSELNRYILFGGAINQRPTAAFAISCAGLACTFSDRSTDDAAPVSWQWDFGDGTISTLQNPSHTYASARQTLVTLTVSDAQALSNATSETLVVPNSGDPDSTTPTVLPVSQQRSAGLGEWKYFKVLVPAGKTRLVVSITNSGCPTIVVCMPDLDLYVRRGQRPDDSTYECAPMKNGSTESCSISSPPYGYWYIGIYTFYGLPSQAGGTSAFPFTLSAISS